MDITIKTCEKIACFIHSTTLELNKDTFLIEILEHLKTSTLIDRLSYLCINNTGMVLDEVEIERKYAPAKVIHHSNSTNEFENPTIKLMYAFCKLNPDYKVLYLHTKGVSYTANHVFFPGINSWNLYMRHCLIDNFPQCLDLLNVYDTVGCNYRQLADGNPQHYSGNYWWASGQYISSLTIAYLRDKYDPEFWVLRNNPTYFNIHILENMYQNVYQMEQYKDDVRRGLSDNVLFCKMGSNPFICIANMITMAYVQNGNKVVILDDMKVEIDIHRCNERLKPYKITLVPKQNVHLEIANVQYGLLDIKTIDLTEQVVRLFFQPNRLFIPTGTSFNTVAGSDPCPGKTKQIYIEYLLNSIPFRKVFSERIIQPIDINSELNDSEWIERNNRSDSRGLATIFDMFLEILES